VRTIEIEKRADGNGFKLVALPGSSFFDDYEDFYIRQTQSQLRFRQTAALREIQQPLELVAYFHKLLAHDQHTFNEKETAYAARLLETYPVEALRDLVDYAVQTASHTGYKMQVFGAIKGFIPRWEVDAAHRAVERKRREAIRQCALCNDSGYLTFEEADGRIVGRPPLGGPG
jgi:hypothetical protein